MFLSLGILFCYLAYVLFISPILFPFDKEIKNYVKDNLIPIEGVDPNNLNFDDLIKLEQSIAESSVVFLGEQDRGDAATFLAKTRIIKFLHQKMGFNVLVFESDFYGVNQSWNLAKAGKASADEYRYNIYPHWTHCVECSELFKYIDSNFNTPNEITVAGVDPRHVMKYSRENFYNNFKKLVEEMELVQNTTDRTLFFEILRELLNNEYESNITIDRQEFFHSTIGAMSQRLDPNSFWSQELKNLNGFAFSSFESLPSNNSRDIQMADNLMWLLNNKYKGRKVIF